jgi:hypothetical protein
MRALINDFIIFAVVFMMTLQSPRSAWLEGGRGKQIPQMMISRCTRIAQSQRRHALGPDEAASGPMWMSIGGKNKLASFRLNGFSTCGFEAILALICVIREILSILSTSVL